MGAQCTHIFGGAKRRLSEAEWLQISLGRISFHYLDWADLRQSIEILCAKTKKCNVVELKARLDDFEYEIDMDQLEAIGGIP